MKSPKAGLDFADLLMEVADKFESRAASCPVPRRLVPQPNNLALLAAFDQLLSPANTAR